MKPKLHIESDSQNLVPFTRAERYDTPYWQEWRDRIDAEITRLNGNVHGLSQRMNSDMMTLEEEKSVQLRQVQTEMTHLQNSITHLRPRLLLLGLGSAVTVTGVLLYLCVRLPL